MFNDLRHATSSEALDLLLWLCGSVIRSFFYSHTFPLLYIPTANVGAIFSCPPRLHFFTFLPASMAASHVTLVATIKFDSSSQINIQKIVLMITLSQNL